jgi:ribosome maturation factor RimP
LHSLRVKERLITEVNFVQAKDIVKLVEKLAMPVIEENGFEFVDAEFVKEGPNKYLRLYVDKPGGIAINDCEVVSRYLDERLSDDITDEPYILEVSSPGIDRILKREHEYVKYSGKTVDVKLFKAVDGRKEFRGTLKGLVDDNVVICDDDGNEMSFPRKEVASTRLAVMF